MLRSVCLSLFLSLLLFQVACTNNDEDQPKPALTRLDKIPDPLGTWCLVKIWTGFPGKLIEKKITDSRQYFQLHADSTFRYTYPDGTQATGRFSLRKNTEGRESLLLTCQPGSTFPHQGNRIALAPFNIGLLVESYSMNDGPTYFYQKVEAGPDK